MSPPYKHSLKCIQVNQIKNNIKGTLEGKEDIISQNDSPKLKDWDVGGGGVKRSWNPIFPDSLNTLELCLLKCNHRSISGNFNPNLGLHSPPSLLVISQEFQEFFSPLNYGSSQSTKSGAMTPIAINQIELWVGAIIKRRNV